LPLLDPVSLAFVVDAKNRKSGPLGAVAFTPVAEWLTVMGLLPDGVKTGQGGPLPRDIHLEAAYYPLARDRFGFHDDLADLAVADWSALRLSYLVVGSYTRSSEDPLARLGNDSERLDWLDDARLEVDLPRPRHVQATSVHHDPLTSVRRLDPALVSLSFAGDRKKQVSYPLDKLGELGLGPSATTEGRLGALRGEIDATQAVAAALSGIKLTPRPLLPTPDDDKGVPSRLVCHGAIVDLGPSGAYTGLGVLPNNPSCRIADSASAAIEEAFAGIGGGDVFAILRGGLDGELGDTTGMQALPYLLHAAGFDGAPDEAHTTELVATIRDTGPTLGLANLDPNAPVRVVDRRTLTGPTAPAAVAVKDLGTLPGAVTVEARKVPAPRWHRAGTPVVQIERAGRSFRHGHDGRMRQDGPGSGTVVSRGDVTAPGYGAGRTVRPASAIAVLASATVNSPKWKIDAARTASAPPSVTPRTRWSSVPTPPEAMTGTFTRSATARVTSTSKPSLVPSRSIEVSRISPAPRAATRSTHSSTSTPVGVRPPCTNSSQPDGVAPV